MPGIYYGGVFGVGETFLCQHLLKNVGKLVPKSRSVSEFYHFRNHFITGIRMFFLKDSLMGLAFTGVICFFTPQNAFLLIWLTNRFDHLSPYMKFFYGSVLSIQLIFIFLVHYTLSKYMPLIAQPAKKLCSISAAKLVDTSGLSLPLIPPSLRQRRTSKAQSFDYRKLQRIQNLIPASRVRFELHLNHLVSIYFSNNSFSATYGDRSKLTINSFTKVSFCLSLTLILSYL